jgi:hypothetical protein
MAIEKKIELKTYYLKRWFLTHHRSLFEKRGKKNKYCIYDDWGQWLYLKRS